MADVFISYTRDDRVRAETVAAAFVADGYTAFYDANIAPGDSWDHRIEGELAAAKAVVVLWSTASRERQWVRNEARDGMRRGILCPALIDDCAVPIEFSHIQAADLRHFASVAGHAGWAQLSAAVRAKVHGAAGAAPAPQIRVSHGASDLPPHLAMQLNQALNAAVAAAARLDLNPLNRDVCRAVEVARRDELAAITAQHRAWRAAELAEDGARRARGGEHGYSVQNLDSGARYEGAWAERFWKNSSAEGYGVLSYGAGHAKAGVRYAGAWKTKQHGSGVHRFANSIDSLRYEGEFAVGELEGHGVYYWRGGDRLAGSFHGEATKGAGVHYFADGRRYEGEHTNCKWNGHGVLWDTQGRIVSQGVWKDGELVTPLAR